MLTEHFDISEFDCHDGTEVPEDLLGNVKLLAENLEVLRKEIGKPIHVNSGYRTPAYNEKIGGEKNSFHKKAMAADITVAGLTPRQVHLAIDRLLLSGKMRQGGLGLYKTFVHYDVRGVKARWNG